MQSEQPLNNYPLAKDAYLAFDALTLRQLILDKLNASGVYTDQNFVGSNLASIVDIIAYSFHTLIFYLNRTSTESMFTEAQLYENINRIVKILDYNPIGYQTSLLAYFLDVTEPTGLQLLNNSTYIIPRYSYITLNNISYSLNSDIFFNRNSTQEPQSIATNDRFLYQGRFREYSPYIALGEANETMLLAVDKSIKIDHHNIHVYVYSDSKWSQYEKAANLYLENGQTRKYEMRLNGDKLYEFKFGDNINARQLQKGDIVRIYYLVSDGVSGVVGDRAFGSGTSTATPLSFFNTTAYRDIIYSLYSDDMGSNILIDKKVNYCKVYNTTGSTLPREYESVDDIKSSAPAAFRSQYKLTSENDYASFVKINFSNIVSDVLVMNNTSYMSEYMRYYYNLGLTTPSLNTRALYNQVLFGTPCNFNNVYIVVVPKAFGNSITYLLPQQKQLIKIAIDQLKVLTTQTVFVDPVYIACAVGLVSNTENFTVGLHKQTKIRVVKSADNKRSNDSLIADIVQIFSDYFDHNNCTLGQTINSRTVEQRILDIPGIERVSMYRVDDPTITFGGLGFFIWNNAFGAADRINTLGNHKLADFQFPYLFDLNDLAGKIEVV